MKSSLPNASEITPRELDILGEIGRVDRVSQRRIAEEVGLSIGMTNMIIKRLVNKGLIKVRRLNRRNVEYLLTKNGIAENTKRTYRYIRHTLSSLRHLKGMVREVLEAAVVDGPDAFFNIEGDGEIADLTEIVLREMSRERAIRWGRDLERSATPEGAVIRLLCGGVSSERSGSSQTIAMEDALAQAGRSMNSE